MPLAQAVNSPLTGKDARLTACIPSARLIELYRKQFGYDASHCFVDVPDVGIYQCDTGFRFYYPFTIAGDESLYRCIAQCEDLRYQRDKWEFNAALSYVEAGNRVLDVGCAEGAFLAKARHKGATVSGIELNKEAARIATGKGIQVHEELLEQHHPEKLYDVVTGFQILEHVVDPLGFVRECIRVLRPGGTLVIGVPNNESFIRLAPDFALNQPPHHMGLWDRKSLAALADIVGLAVTCFDTEPLAEKEWYQAVFEYRYLGRWRRRLFYWLGFARIFAQFIRENAHTIAGHTILAVYRNGSS